MTVAPGKVRGFQVAKMNRGVSAGTELRMKPRLREALDTEIKHTGVLRESLTREISLLENLIKQ